MILLLGYFIIACLFIYCVRLLLPMAGIPPAATNAICILLVIVFLVILMGGGYGLFKIPLR